MMTPRPLLLRSRLSALPGELQQGAASGGALAASGRSGARRSLGKGPRLGSGCGCGGPNYCPAAGATTLGRGGSKRGAEVAAGRVRHPGLVYLDALGGGGTGLLEQARRLLPAGGCGVEARAAPEGGGPGARRMCCLTLRRPLGSRSSGTQHFLSLREPDTDSSLRAPRLRGLPRPRPTPSTPSTLHALHAPRPAPLPREGPPLALSCGSRKQSTWGGQSVYLGVIGRTHLSCCKQKSFSILGAAADIATLNNFHSQTTTLRSFK